MYRRIELLSPANIVMPQSNARRVLFHLSQVYVGSAQCLFTLI